MNKKKILLIDDEASNTRPMKVNLDRTGRYTVQTENNALHALETARQFKPDLIFLDVMMPDMDGGQVAAQMEIDPALKNVPIVFLTAIVTKKRDRRTRRGQSRAQIYRQAFEPRSARRLHRRKYADESVRN